MSGSIASRFSTVDRLLTIPSQESTRVPSRSNSTVEIIGDTVGVAVALPAGAVRRSRMFVEIDSLLFHDQRTVEDTGVDCRNILAEQPDKEQLH